jgi:hypothetical protein
MEVGKLLDGPLNPPDLSLPAFHVVAPSIPGRTWLDVAVCEVLGVKEISEGRSSVEVEAELRCHCSSLSRDRGESLE